MAFPFQVNLNSFEKKHKTITNLSIMSITFLLILLTLLLFSAHIRSEYFNARAQASASPPPVPMPGNTSAKSLCARTVHSKTCLDTIGSIPSAPVEIYIELTINASVKGIKNAFYEGMEYRHRASSGVDGMSVEDCIEMIGLAGASAEEALSISGLYKYLRPNVKTFLSAAVSHLVTCLDGIKNEEIRTDMFRGIHVPMNQIGNALAMVDLDLNNNNDNTNASKLGNEVEATNLTWFSAAERRRLLVNFGSTEKEPIAVVGPDEGEGEYKTINEALQGMPMGRGYIEDQGWYVIHVKAGTYRETVTIEKHMVNVFMYGDGPRLTVITGNRTTDAFTLYRTATFSVVGKGFIGKSMTFENTGNATARGVQGVALRVHSDTAAFSDCRIHGYKVSLHALAFRQFFTGCIISGNRDFLYGDSAMVIQNSVIMVRRSKARSKMITIISQGRFESHENTGFVLQNCTFKLEQVRKTGNSSRPDIYLGRPKRPYSRTVVMESDLSDLIQPQGWTVGSDTSLQQTVTCIEYDNRGLSATTSTRVVWKGFTAANHRADLEKYTVENFIRGPQWLDASGIIYQPGLLG